MWGLSVPFNLIQKISCFTKIQRKVNVLNWGNNCAMASCGFEVCNCTFVVVIKLVCFMPQLRKFGGNEHGNEGLRPEWNGSFRPIFSTVTYSDLCHGCHSTELSPIKQMLYEISSLLIIPWFWDEILRKASLWHLSTVSWIVFPHFYNSSKLFSIMLLQLSNCFIITPEFCKQDSLSIDW